MVLFILRYDDCNSVLATIQDRIVPVCVQPRPLLQELKNDPPAGLFFAGTTHYRSTNGMLLRALQ